MLARMSYDAKTLSGVVAYLETASILTRVFGGWAEEMQGLSAARPHRDIDLLYPSNDFEPIDTLVRQRGLEEITAKRSAYKRALLLRGVMTELFLVRRNALG